MDCVFCKIVNQEIPSYTIYEDEIVMAFLDIKPDSNGHTLIIPKKHYNDLSDIDSDTLLHIFKTSKKIKERLENILKCDGLTLIQNNGVIQEVKHFHIHLKPYYKNKEIIDIKKIYEKIKL